MKHNTLTFFLLCALVLFAGTAGAQEVRVVNKVTLEPVRDVLLYHTPTNLYEITNEKGKAVVTGLELLDTLRIKHQSYVAEAIQMDDLLRTGYVIYLSQKVVLIEEVIITASKSKELISEISNQIETITDEEIRFRNPQNSADLLEQTGDVYVQRSQMGGGSPVLRGFEANKVLLVVDGVRMNNAIYRNGHLQNVVTIDPSSLERAEVVFGPGAVMYGSDAIGGVMHFVTQDPMVTGTKGVHNIKGNFYTRFASVNMEKTGHASLNAGFHKWGTYTAVTFSDFDDLRMGDRRTHGFGEWGLSNYYIDQVNGVDTILANPDPNKQLYTGYYQWNLLQKFKVKPSERFSVGLNFQATSSSNIPRYEEMNDFEIVDGLPETLGSAEWYYGPQKRYMAALTLGMDARKAFDEANFTLAYQWIEESRIQRKYRKTVRRYSIEHVQVASLNGDFSKKLSEKNLFRYGFEVDYNHVESEVIQRNIYTDEVVDEPFPSRYPDGGSNTQAYAFYFMDKWQPSPKVVVQAGVRYNHFILQSSFRDTTFIKLPTPDYKLSRGALSGSLGMVYKPIAGLEVKASASTGFRAPNVDDYGKVREMDGEVTVPNLDLKPEYAYNVEAGLVKNFDNIARMSITGYYTHVSDAIVRSHRTMNGSDSLMYEGDSVYTVTNENIQNARVFGFSVGFYTDIGRYISMTANFNYTRGRELPSKTPMAHIPPLYGKVSILAKVKRFQGEVFVNFNGQKTRDEYSDGTEDRPDEATLQGTPGWFTLNLRTTAQLHEHLSFQFAIENIFDQHYKTYSSGLSAPGRNFILTLRSRF